MLVTRHNQNRTKVSGHGLNGAPKDNRSKSQAGLKESPSLAWKEKDNGSTRVDNGKAKGTMTQQNKPSPTPNAVKPIVYNSVPQKRKGSCLRNEYKFDFNPFLKQPAQNQIVQPSYKPTNTIVIDLNLSTEIPILDATISNPSGEASSSSTNNSNPKDPPDISLLPTQTYHEYARNTGIKGQLPQDQVDTRIRDRSCSPNRNHMVDKGSGNEGKEQGEVPGMHGDTPSVNEAIQEAQTIIVRHAEQH